MSLALSTRFSVKLDYSYLSNISFRSNKSFRFSKFILFYPLFLNKIIFNNRLFFGGAIFCLFGFFAEMKVEKYLRVYFIGYENCRWRRFQVVIS